MKSKSFALAIQNTELKVDLEQSSIRYRYPSFYYKQRTLNKILSKKGIFFQLTQLEKHTSELTIRDPDHRILDRFREVFSEVNDLPCYFQTKPFQNSTTPLVSCIILLTANDFFVRALMIPSLIENSSNHEIEIIIAYNGPRTSLDEFSEFPVIRSDFGWVAKGYNSGVKAAKGKYIAIFHDDCLIEDPDWIDKCIRELNQKIWAITTELRCSNSSYSICVAKNTPLFMSKNHFEQLGGYDEKYYFGLEDVDFTYLILSRGKQIKEINFKYFHGSGMSTIIFISQNAKMYQTLFGLNAFSFSLLGLLQNFYRNVFKNQHIDSLVIMAKYRLYFLEKFRRFLSKSIEIDALNAEDQNAKAILKYSHNHAWIDDRAQLIQTWRNWVEEVS